jgi:hypothetical protein
MGVTYLGLYIGGYGTGLHIGGYIKGVTRRGLQIGGYIMVRVQGSRVNSQRLQVN